MKISAQKLFSILNLKYEKNNFKEIIGNVSSVLTNIGFEIEDIHYEEEEFKHFIIAKVEDAQKHPESSKLSICSVNTGTEVLQIICGAPNVRKGINVVLAQKGAVIPKNKMVIQKTKLAGMESNGMICSADELCIGTNDGTILEISSDVLFGTPYAEYVNKNDAILNIAITPNRGDALSYTGIARELAAQGFGVFEPLNDITIQTKPLTVDLQNNEFAPSVFFGKFANVEHIPVFNDILKKGDVSITQFPIVNLLNYITEIYGQPMHIYDASKIKGNICIRSSVAGEKLVTISGEEIILQDGDVVIADDEKILSLAGIMGDLRSAVTNATKEYILECCTFNRDNIFRTIRKYNINTHASFRFERYVDGGNTKYFPQKAVSYKLSELLKVQFTQTFEMPCNLAPSTIICSVGHIARILGVEIPLNEVVQVLTGLGFTCTGDEGSLKITVPSWRAFDVKQANDIAEEVIRSIGVTRCQRKHLVTWFISPAFKVKQVKDFLSRNLNEVITNPFVSLKDYTLFSDDESLEKAITLANPINIEEPFMRSSIIPSLLRNVANAERFSVENTRIFEVAKTFTKNSEEKQVCIMRSGFTENNNPIYKAREYNVFDIKEDVLCLLENVYDLKRESIFYNQITQKSFHPYQAFEIKIGRNVIATIGQIHPAILEEYSIKNKVFVANIYLNNIPLKQTKSSVKSGYTPMILPDIKRELSIVVDNNTTCMDILRNLQKITKNRFTASITDIYQNDALHKEGKKSILISFDIFQHSQTLNSAEIDSLISEINLCLQQSVNALLRGNV